jgi:hypothetical protein
MYYNITAACLSRHMMENNKYVFCIESENMILPCTKSVPSTFIDMFLKSTNTDYIKNKPVDIIINENTIYKNITGLIHLDILIGYIAQDIDIVQLCSLINYAYKYIHISKDTVIKYLRMHIENIGTDTYVWNQLENKTEYTFYQFKKRNWPVKKQNNIDWQIIAQKIGLVEKIYPCEGKKNVKKPNNIIGDAEQEHKDLDIVIDINDLDDDLDDDSDDNDTDLLKLLTDKDKQVKREEKIRTLILESNYAAYGIPDIKEIECKIGFTKKDVVDVFNAAITMGQQELALLYACRLFVSRKYYHLAIKNVQFMSNIKMLMKKNLRIYRLLKYVMSYSFYMMLKEERLLGRKITKNNRAIMDEDEFRSLPVFDGELDESPYCTEIFHNKKYMNMREQLPMYLGGKREFTEKKEFTERLSIVTGKMLDGIDLSEHGAFLTGSSLLSCVVTNPLEENFKHCDKPFETYMENYYPSYSSIRVYREKFDESKKNMIALFNTNFKATHKQFCIHIDNEDEFVSYITKISNDYGSAIDAVRTGGEELARTYSEFINMEKKIADLDVAVMATTMEEYTTNVLAIVAKIRTNLPAGPDHLVYLYKQEVKYGFKWVLKGPGAKRPIDFFKVWVPAHVLLHKFHLNNVRFWWDGKKVRSLCSGVCAALTGVNQWYRWFSNNKDPMSIVLKNTQRGYTTLLNTKEIEVLQIYIKEVDQYKYIGDTFVIGKIHRNHTIFGHIGGIRWQFPTIPPICEQYINIPQYWSNPDYTLKRLGCSLETNSYGKIIAPKIYAFVSIICDLLD